jgi:hypothetical protein
MQNLKPATARDHQQLWDELREKAKNDPELARKLEAMERVIDRNREALQRLADS